MSTRFNGLQRKIPSIMTSVSFSAQIRWYFSLIGPALHPARPSALSCAPFLEARPPECSAHVRFHRSRPTSRSSGATGTCSFPPSLARGPWYPGTQHGSAMLGLLAHAIEEAPAANPSQVTRLTVDLLRAAPMTPTRAPARVVKRGKSMDVIEATLEADGQVFAKASAMRFRVNPIDTSFDRPRYASGPFRCPRPARYSPRSSTRRATKRSTTQWSSAPRSATRRPSSGCGSRAPWWTRVRSRPSSGRHSPQTGPTRCHSCTRSSPKGNATKNDRSAQSIRTRASICTGRCAETGSASTRTSTTVIRRGQRGRLPPRSRRSDRP